MPEGAEGAPGPAEGGASGDGGDKKEEGNKHKKLLRLLTVFAYLSTVSGTAFMLSLYYLFLWTPKVQLGGKALVQDPPPPGTLALFYPEMVPQLAARVADQEKPPGAEWAARTRAGAPPGGKMKAEGGGGESQVPATPQLVLPSSSIEDPAEAFGKRREARSTLMEMSTTEQGPPATATGQWGGGRGQTARPQQQPRVASSATPPHRTKNRGGGEQPWHSTPHPAEVAAHA